MKRTVSGFGLLLLLVGIAGYFAAHRASRVVHAAGDAADTAMATIRPEAIRAGMRFLSDDLLEGRGTATRGYQIAAKYMATQWEGLGLSPAGDNGTYFQEVPLRSMRVDQTRSSMSLLRDGQERTLTFKNEFLMHGDPVRADTAVEAPIVFVGFGTTAPEQHYDDYQNVDVHGKIVALIYGAPNFASSVKAHYSSIEEKEKAAVAHGAVGLIILSDPVLEQMYSFNEEVRDLASPEFRWLDKTGNPNDYFPELKASALLSLEETKKLFAGTGHTPEEIFLGAKKGKLTSFPLPITAKLRTVTTSQDVHSPNVVAKLAGSDPTLKNEYVVYTAHLDHLGIAAPENGDAIYNGALDNASGSALLLELARAYSGMPVKPRRSILFVAVTGEEAGLLGSDYFAHFPTVPKNALVANVNTDEDLMLWPMQDVIAFGAEHTSLGAVVQKAADRMHLKVSEDPMPEQVVFIRSDQYSFVKEGIPAVMPSPGFVSSDPKIKPLEIFQKWEETRYHHPGDDMDQPGLDFQAAADFAKFAFLCGWYVAQDDQRPTWNKNDFFGEHFAHAAK